MSSLCLKFCRTKEFSLSVSLQLASKTIVPSFSVSLQLASKIVVPNNKFGAQFAVVLSNKIGVVFELQSCRTAPAGSATPNYRNGRLKVFS